MFDSELLFIIMICILIPLCAVWVYFDAKKRGKRDPDAIRWAIGTLFLVIFVLPAWLWTRPNFEVANEFLCPECKEVYRGKRISCPYCGYMVVDDEVVDLSGAESMGEEETSREV